MSIDEAERAILELIFRRAGKDWFREDRLRAKDRRVLDRLNRKGLVERHATKGVGFVMIGPRVLVIGAKEPHAFVELDGGGK